MLLLLLLLLLLLGVDEELLSDGLRRLNSIGLLRLEAIGVEVEGVEKLGAEEGNH